MSFGYGYGHSSPYNVDKASMENNPRHSGNVSLASGDDTMPLTALILPRPVVEREKRKACERVAVELKSEGVSDEGVVERKSKGTLEQFLNTWDLKVASRLLI